VESDVHFPTDYNLLWDCARKCMDTINKISEKHPQLKGWRKLPNWRYEIKGLMHEFGKAASSGGKGKPERVSSACKKYLQKAARLSEKIHKELPNFPLDDIEDVGLSLVVEEFAKLLDKHIDLVNRRILKGEKRPHEEKMFSIFETYTEWVKKGKTFPNVELGRKLSITTDQYGLIIDYRLMTDQQDRDIVVPLADDLFNKYNMRSWNFDKGFWRKENKELLQLEVSEVIMPKLGKRNKTEDQEETTRTFRRLKNKHSAIESNINELENSGLDRCPDRGFHHFTRYISLVDNTEHADPPIIRQN
jgi:transposase, IS5 family